MAKTQAPVRYAVVGLGHIAQTAVLPAFAHAKSNSKLVALVSDSPRKLKALGKRYRAAHLASYSAYDELLSSGEIDAVYIALPNSMHRDYTERAAAKHVHVLCEKPLAHTASDALAMIDACARANVKLMTAYRLHYEPANLAAIEAVRRKIGEPRSFTSSFCMQVKAPNIRLEKDLGGGPLMDIGIYCLNAVRHLFEAEPIEAFATVTRGDDRRFAEVEEALVCHLRFSGDRVASFICSFGSQYENVFQVLGTKGAVQLDKAFGIDDRKTLTIMRGERKEKRVFAKGDPFAPELVHFSESILEDLPPISSGDEGLRDLVAIEALMESAKVGRIVTLPSQSNPVAFTRRQQIRRPPVAKVKLVGVRAPH